MYNCCGRRERRRRRAHRAGRGISFRRVKKDGCKKILIFIRHTRSVISFRIIIGSPLQQQCSEVVAMRGG